MKKKSAYAKKDVWESIKEWQNDPEFIRATYEFIRHHTGKSPKY